MESQGANWLVEAALRCYPASWRRRHGREAADLAALLIHDGTSAGSIACSYLAGAVREWLTPRSGRRLSTLAYALLIAACLVSLSMGLLARTAPARAASTSQAHAHAHCRTDSQEAARRVTSATGRLQVLIREAEHDRGC